MTSTTGFSPRLPVGEGGGPTTKAPPDVEPSVSISLPARIVAGTPISVTARTDAGTTWEWLQADLSWEPKPIVSYTGQFDWSTDAAIVSSGAVATLTFPRAGTHQVKVVAHTAQGTLIPSPMMNVTVAPVGPPAFTVVSPTTGTTVNLNEGGGHITVQLTTTPDQFLPFGVTIALDGAPATPPGVFLGTQFQTPVTLPPMPLGSRTITITCTDPSGLQTTQSRSLVGRDVAPPHLEVSDPQPSANVIGDANGAVMVSVHGTARDAQSGMVGGLATVQWALTPTGPRTTAQPIASNDFSGWLAQVPLKGFGAHTIYLSATDNAGNATPLLALPIQVISSFVPANLEERLNQRQYLAALLAFAHEQITVPGTPPAALDTSTLVTALGQPLDRLSQPLSAAADRGEHEINQLRLPVELLRAQIATTNANTTPGASGEANYRSAAYTSLLSAIGTSYTELRLARGADPSVRRDLAARLGIVLSATTPDELDLLVLDGANLTEAALETYFGLPDSTAADPLRVPPTPLVLTWQTKALALSWAGEDLHPSPPRPFVVTADPDVISWADVTADPKGGPIRQLLTQRAGQLADYVKTLDGLRTASATPVAGLAAMQAKAVPNVDLAALEAQEAAGVDISAALDAAGLTRSGFVYLRTLSRLAAKGSVTPAEWSDATAVLSGVFKRSLYPTWLAQETGFILSPDFFLLNNDAAAAPTTNPRRTDPQARTQWQALLRRRIAQWQNVNDANANAVAAAEQAALPLLRDALLQDVATGATSDIGEDMSALFLVDVKAGGSLRTTRIAQAIESVQSLLSAKRSGELTAAHPAATWTVNDFQAFTRAWAWMGQLDSWRAATTAFLFPERNLDPTLLVPNANATPPVPLDALWSTIQGSGPFTAADADAAGDAYVKTVGQSFKWKPEQFFSYVDHRRLPTHQTTLSQLSAAITASPTPGQGVVASREMFWAVPLLLAQRLHSAGDFAAALDWYWTLFPYDNSAAVSIYDRINGEKPFAPNLVFPPGWTDGLDPFALVATRPTPYTRYTLLAIIRCHIDFADAEFTRETDESIANARILYVAAWRLLGSTQLQPLAPTNPGEPALAIPEIDSLRSRAEVQLAKLRQGRNIAGIPRTQGLPTTTAVSQPTPYRYKTLLDRAKQLIAQAAQMEAGYLAALEKYDQKNLQLYDATKAVDLTAAQVTLSVSRVNEANDAVVAAQAQQSKADSMVAAYGDAIAAGPNKYEKDMLGEYGDMRDVKDVIAGLDATIGIAQTAAKSSNMLDAFFSGGASVLSGVVASVAIGAKAVSQGILNDMEAQMQANQLQASIEQRIQAWRLEQTSAQQDSLVAAAQVRTARDQVDIATQEQAVATLQQEQAVATLKFLAGQFTNADLYWWMSNTLGSVYRYFLQQATATARLAQAQLAFERAEPPQTLIRNDYWQSPAEMTANAAQVDRRGLTGAERLSQDLAGLDDYAFNSDRRRLNLSQTFSLARLLPVEFMDFRRTGTLAFSTPMSLFDSDFPGHYQRQIRQVRTSVVALVSPPDRGIRATLYSNGISTVTTGRDGVFQDITVRHDPGVVALTSPINASGVFEFDAQSDMLLPFESSGVDTTWELELPPAANPFDFSTIVDVLVTIEYTALFDYGYRTQVVNRLNAKRDRGADCLFSLARDFPDQWYDLNNPSDPNARSITITLRDVDFPPKIDGMTTAAIAVRLSSNDDVPATVVSLHHSGGGGDATVTDGIASTRRGNASSWNALCGTNPAGAWQLSFGADAATLFAGGEIDDLLLAISWIGQAPEWAQ